MSARLGVLCAVKVNEMFTAMISRTYLAVTLIGVTLAAGAGWGLYEQRRERAVEAPVSGTETRAPQPVGDPAAAPEAPVAETSASETAAPAEVAQAAGKSALDRGSADATTAPARLPTAAPVDAPREVAGRPAPAARPSSARGASAGCRTGPGHWAGATGHGFRPRRGADRGDGTADRGAIERDRARARPITASRASAFGYRKRRRCRADRSSGVGAAVRRRCPRSRVRRTHRRTHRLSRDRPCRRLGGESQRAGRGGPADPACGGRIGPG